MRAITSREKVLKKLKNHQLICGIGMFYLSDFHKTPIGKSIANKLINEGVVEPSSGCHWFERCWRLKR